MDENDAIELRQIFEKRVQTQRTSTEPIIQKDCNNYELKEYNRKVKECEDHSSKYLHERSAKLLEEDFNTERELQKIDDQDFKKPKQTLTSLKPSTYSTKSEYENSFAR